MRAWDVFISHASEDKDEVAIPLAGRLRRAGLRVWLDRQELRIGDSLHEKIDEGLANSRYGIVILSPDFVAKRFPRQEFDAFLTKEGVAGHKLILPVWHHIDKAAVVAYSPRVAGRLPGRTADGLDAVAAGIIDVVTAAGGPPGELAPTPLRLLIDLLDQEPTGAEVVAFLGMHPRLVSRALGARAGSERWHTPIGPLTLDLCASRERYTTGEIDWHLVQFQPPAAPLFSPAGASPLEARVAELRDLRRWVGANLGQSRETLPLLSPSFRGVVVAGRRQRLTQADVARLRDYSDELSGVTVRTYDWLIDSAAEEPSSEAGP
jgi:hypothetical protein